MHWAIYISIPIRDNFNLALEKQTWGAKKDAFSDLQDGDTILFVQEMPGSVRVKDGKAKVAKRVVLATVDGAPYQSADPLWPDDTYAYRFNFLVTSTQSNVSIPGPQFGPDVAEAVRASSCVQCAPRQFKILLRDEVAEIRAELEDAVQAIESGGQETLSDDIGKDHPKSTQRSGVIIERDPKVIVATKKRAEYACEAPGCSSAPFVKNSGKPYIEVHHLHPLADGGPDRIWNTVCLCPNHHREIHYGANAAALRKSLSHLHSKQD